VAVGTKIQIDNKGKPLLLLVAEPSRDPMLVLVSINWYLFFELKN
jgi:hypothetical protein